MEKLRLWCRARRAKLAVTLFDLAAIPTAWYLAYWLRYNMHPFPSNLSSQYSLYSLAILSIVQLGCYYHFKVYRGLWRFSSLNDVERIIKASFLATVLTIPLLYWSSLLTHIPRSVFPLYTIVLITELCGGRMLLRAYEDRGNREAASKVAKRVLVVGAGRAGESLVRDLVREKNYLALGFIDDAPSKQGLELHAVPVLGTVADLVALVHAKQADLIFIATPTASSAEMRRIVQYCEQSGVPFRTLPGLSALVSGQVKLDALREVHLEDLLGRDQVQHDLAGIQSLLKGKRVLVTGGGGSIGSELCRQILANQPAALLILDSSEFNLYQIELDLRALFPKAVLCFVLASVTDRKALKLIFNDFLPDIVFHAAAYKHVPLLEGQVSVAVKNNIFGTQSVAEAAIAVSAEKFVLISTDKAVNPSNVMGASKRLAELLCQSLNFTVSTQFIMVRFGNVLGSMGSVVPLFQRQLQRGGPLTVTHPEIERFFMTIPEACQLILQALLHGQGGEIFVLDMGEPIKIRYLAEQMIRLAGKEPNIDINIEYTGLRPGEKLYEELFHSSELLQKTAHEKLFKARLSAPAWQRLSMQLARLYRAAENTDNQTLLALLAELVPEYRAARVFDVIE